MRSKLEIQPLGDCAVLLRFQNNAAAVKAQRQLESARIAGVIECAAAFETVAVFLEPSFSDRFDQLIEDVRTAVSRLSRRRLGPASRTLQVAVCFDGEFGLDLEDVAGRAGLTRAEAIQLFCSADYRVACLGFTAGFPYLTGLPVRLATPRRATPRREVPAGSVGIGGQQAGIYPTSSPGGWNIVGRTNLRLFDPGADPPAALSPGDRVRFHAVASGELMEKT